MTLVEIIEQLDAVILTDYFWNRMDIRWACAADLMSDVLAHARNGSVLITGLSKKQALITANITGIKIVVFTKGKEPDSETVSFALNNKIDLLITRYSLYTACGILYSKGLRCCPEEQ
jgi:hypothetical protein